MSSETPTLPQIAAQRGRQTLAQGLLVVVVMAALAAGVESLRADSWRAWLGSWEMWTYSAFQAAVTAGVAYLVRRYRDTSGVVDIADIPRRALPETPEDVAE